MNPFETPGLCCVQAHPHATLFEGGRSSESPPPSRQAEPAQRQRTPATPTQTPPTSPRRPLPPMPRPPRPPRPIPTPRPPLPTMPRPTLHRLHPQPRIPRHRRGHTSQPRRKPTGPKQHSPHALRMQRLESRPHTRRSARRPNATQHRWTSSPTSTVTTKPPTNFAENSGNARNRRVEHLVNVRTPVRARGVTPSHPLRGPPLAQCQYPPEFVFLVLE